MQAGRTLVAFALVACSKSSPSPAPAPGSASAAPAPIAADAAVAVVVDAGTPDAAGIACTAAAIGQARKQAEAFVRAGNYAAAIPLLEPGGCYLDADQPDPLKLQIAWRISDLAFAYYKAGKPTECYATASGQLAPYHGNVAEVFEDSHAVMRALDHNRLLCHDAIEKERGPFEDGGDCDLVAGGYALPPAVLDPKDEAACVVIGETSKDADNMNVCGDVTLVRQSKAGKRSRTKLAVDGGNLVDGGVCCEISGMGFARRKGKLALLVGTVGRNCDGGTAASETEYAYELTGTKLTVFHSLEASAH